MVPAPSHDPVERDGGSRLPRRRRSRWRLALWAGLVALGLGSGWIAWRWYLADRLLDAAESDFARGRWVSALALARRELALWPDDARGASMAARCLTRLNRAKEA